MKEQDSSPLVEELCMSSLVEVVSSLVEWRMSPLVEEVSMSPLVEEQTWM